jgi:hypothetical protein
MMILQAELVQEQAEGSCSVLQGENPGLNSRPAFAGVGLPVGQAGDSFKRSVLSACLAGVIKPIDSQLVGIEAASEQISMPPGNLQ